MITPKFYFRNNNNANKDTGTIYVSFYLQRKKIHFSTKVNCIQKNWDNDRMYIKQSEKDADDKNIILESIRSRINNVVVKYRLKDRKLTKDLFLKNYNKPSDFDTFHDFCDTVVKNTRSKLELNTNRMHKSVLKKLKEFNPSLHFDDVDYEFLEAYKKYLTQTLDNSLNTAYKNLAVIRKYIRIAIRSGYMEINPFSDFSISRSSVNIVFLDDDELRKLCNEYNKRNYDEKHKTTIQCFLYMCFSSQHIGDARKMMIEQFNNDNFTYYRIKTRNKKPELITVPISESLRKIFNELADGRDKGLLFRNLPAEQTMNRYLKLVASNAGINKDISHKTGRHTFATIFLEHNPNIKKLQEILGHSDSKTTMMYVHAMEKYKTLGVDCFNNFM